MNIFNIPKGIMNEIPAFIKVLKNFNPTEMNKELEVHRSALFHPHDNPFKEKGLFWFLLKSDFANTYQESNIKIRAKKQAIDPDFRAFIYPLFMHPTTYRAYGNIPNWFDTDGIEKRIAIGKPLYTNEREDLLPLYAKLQMPFYKKVRKYSSSELKMIGETSCIRYEQFMKLVKKYEQERILNIPLDIDLVWRVHMLNHVSYLETTKEYFGKIKNHEVLEQEILNMQIKTTQDIWEETYKTPYELEPFAKKKKVEESSDDDDDCDI